VAATLSVYNMRLRNIDVRATCIVCPTDPTVGRATAIRAQYVPVPLVLCTYSVVWFFKFVLVLYDAAVLPVWLNRDI